MSDMEYDNNSAVARIGVFECAPLLIIAFNRPDLVRGLIRRIAFARPNKLFFAVDGPRNDAEASLVRRTQDAISEIDWPCEVKTLFREENRGCRNGPPEAMSWFFNQVEGGIVLEDDCYPAPEFLRFASELLLRYKNDERIGAITAFNRYNIQTDQKMSYHFSKDLNIWAWASWRRVWGKYDLSLKRYPQLECVIDRHTSNRRMRRYYCKALASVRNGGGATWDFQFGFAFMANHYLSVVPRQRLVANMGIGLAASTHTGGYDVFSKEFSSAGHLSFPLVHPSTIAPDTMADVRTERIMMGLVPRGLAVIGNRVPSCFRPIVSFVGRAIRRFVPFLFEI